MKILIIQTAFIGDVILTLPVAQVLKREKPDTIIDFLCIPSTAELLNNNPFINEVIIYNKRKAGLKGLYIIAKKIRNKNYDVIISPHRSFRSSLIAFLSGCKKTISFDKSDMSSMYKQTVEYVTGIHEIQRNLNLLEPLGIIENKIIKPELFPSDKDKSDIDSLLQEKGIIEKEYVCIAPGSIWFTKRYPEEKYLKLIETLSRKGIPVFIIGGKDDEKLGGYLSVHENVFNLAGKLSLLGSTELIKKAKLLVTNDSAPLHIANAVGTDVIAIFGATIPGFGFYPYGMNDVIFETNGLVCRPCSIHGGNKCPIGTFECMLRIEEENIAVKVMEYLDT
jgi:heptosyltransferase-2